VVSNPLKYLHQESRLFKPSCQESDPQQGSVEYDTPGKLKTGVIVWPYSAASGNSGRKTILNYIRGLLNLRYSDFFLVPHSKQSKNHEIFKSAMSME